MSKSGFAYKAKVRYAREESMPVATSPDVDRSMAALEAWKPILVSKDLQPGQRQAILELAKRGVLPNTIQEALDATKRKPSEIEEKTKEFSAEATKESKLETKPPPGEVLLKRRKTFYKEKGDRDWRNGKVVNEKIDWGSILGWTNTRLNEVATKMKRLQFLELSDEQIQTAIEMFIGKGFSPERVLPNLDPKVVVDTYNEAKDEVARETDPRRKRSVEDVFYERYFGKFDIGADWVKKFLFPNHYKSELREEYRQETPNNIEELAWQIMHTEPDKWGVNGKFPVLQMRVWKDEKTGAYKGDYYVNEANMTRWVRERMMFWHGESPEAPFNFMEVVRLGNKAWRDLSLENMFEAEDTMFKSKDGETEYGDLVNQWKKEAWIVTDWRRKDIDYKQVMNNEKELAKKIQEMFYNSNLTKYAFGKNMFYYIMTLALNFEGKTKKRLVHDSTLGSILNEIYLVYYNMSDFKALQDILGKNSSFFTKDGMLAAMQSVVEQKAIRSGETDMQTIFGHDAIANFQKAFGKDGKVADKNNFISFVNIFATQTPSGNWERMIRKALQNALLERYGQKITTEDGQVKYALLTEEGEEDPYSIQQADLIAYTMVRPTGAGARNDTAASGFDAASKWMNSEAYRRKMATTERGGAFGIPFTVPQFKRMMVDLMNGMTTETSIQYGVKLEPDKKTGKMKEVPQWRKRTPLEIMQELQALRRDQFAYIRQQQAEIESLPEGSADRTQKERELEDLEWELEKVYLNTAGQLEFKEKAMSHYAGNHLNRANLMWDLVMSAKDFNLDKYITYDALGGVRFDRAQFQEAVQDNFLKHIRYLWSTYEQINFNMMVRATVQEPDPDRPGRMRAVWKDMTLGESLFGYEMINRKKFWKKNPDGSWAIKDGRHEIDYNKVQQDKIGLWKQWALMKIAGDLYAHMALHSTDIKKPYHIYQNIIAALAAIPGGIEGNEFDFRGLRISRPFFDKSDIKWLRNMARIENFDIYFRWILKSIFYPGDEKGTGLIEAINLFFKGIVPTG